MNSATTVLIFRLGVALVLYLFLIEVVRAVWRELSPTPAGAGSGHAPPNLQIVGPDVVGPKIKGSGRERRHAGEIILLRDATTIGRELDNDVVVDEETVSSQHARLVVRDGRWWIEDLGSTNGTWVNDAHVNGSQPLGQGDLIRVGRVWLLFSP